MRDIGFSVRPLKHLRVLNLQHCNVEELPARCFEGLQIQRLDLSGNFLTHLPSTRTAVVDLTATLVLFFF